MVLVFVGVVWPPPGPSILLALPRSPPGLETNKKLPLPYGSKATSEKAGLETYKKLSYGFKATSEKPFKRPLKGL
jgi:hypothetical protein